MALVFNNDEKCTDGVRVKDVAEMGAHLIQMFSFVPTGAATVQRLDLANVTENLRRIVDEGTIDANKDIVPDLVKRILSAVKAATLDRYKNIEVHAQMLQRIDTMLKCHLSNVTCDHISTLSSDERDAALLLLCRAAGGMRDLSNATRSSEMVLVSEVAYQRECSTRHSERQQQCAKNTADLQSEVTRMEREIGKAAKTVAEVTAKIEKMSGEEVANASAKPRKTDASRFFLDGLLEKFVDESESKRLKDENKTLRDDIDYMQKDRNRDKELIAQLKEKLKIAKIKESSKNGTK